MKPLRECQLYTFVDAAYLKGRDPAWVAERLCEGGSDLIQFRAKELPASQIRPIARDLLAVTQAHGAGLVINDHPGLAAELSAPACHLGQEDFFEASHRHKSDVFPDGNCLLGLSTHAPAQAERAIAAGADYIAIGPVYPTGTKPGARPVTLEYVRWAAEKVSIPWFAIGGINMGNIGDIIAAGARRVCVVSAILNADDIVRACLQYKEALASAPE